MKYVKVMLTIIAFLLLVLVIKDNWINKAEAAIGVVLENKIIDVNIVSINGKECKDGYIKVMTQVNSNWRK